MYSLSLVLVFALVKYLNARLHCMFDTQDSVEERNNEEEDEERAKGDEGEERGPTAVEALGGGREAQEEGVVGIEMKELRRRGSRESDDLAQVADRETTIQAERIRDRVARGERQGSTFGENKMLFDGWRLRRALLMVSIHTYLDLKVDVHLKPEAERSGSFDQGGATRTEGDDGGVKKDDVVIVVEGEQEAEERERRDSVDRSLQEHSLVRKGSMSFGMLFRQILFLPQGSVTSSVTTSTSGLPSHRLGVSSAEKGHPQQQGGASASAAASRGRSEPRRRFSNLSNLAQSLPSSTSGSMGFPVSLDLEGEDAGAGHADEEVVRRRGNRRRGGSHRHSAAGDAGGKDHDGVAREDGGEVGVRRTRSALETRQFRMPLSRKREERPMDNLVPGDCDSEDDGEINLRALPRIFSSMQCLILQDRNLHF